MSARRDPEQTKREVAVFARFLEAHQSFAATLASYRTAPGDFPDIAVGLKDGGSAGFELGEWLHARQMAEAKRKEKLKAKLRDVLWQRIKQRPRNVEYVAIMVRDATFDRQDADAFATELLRIVSDADESWHQEPWRQQTGYPLSDFAGYQTVGECVESILFWSRNSQTKRIISNTLDNAQNDLKISRLLEQFHREAKAWSEASGSQPTERQQADSWVWFPLEGGAYSSESALQALDEILNNKTTMYANQRTDDLRLIIYYDDAVLYNTPYEDQEHETFADMAGEATRLLTSKRADPFNKIYLLRALRPNPEAFEIWPALRKCA